MRTDCCYCKLLKIRPEPTLLSAGLIWCAHIGFDRAFGYGLKYANGFGFTHLGRIGKFPAIEHALRPEDKIQ